MALVSDFCKSISHYSFAGILKYMFSKDRIAQSSKSCLRNRIYVTVQCALETKGSPVSSIIQKSGIVFSLLNCKKKEASGTALKSQTFIL